MPADEIYTSLLENFDNYLQDTIVGEPVYFLLNAQNLTWAKRKGLRQRVRRHFKAAAENLIQKFTISSNSPLEVPRCPNTTEKKKS